MLDLTGNEIRPDFGKAGSDQERVRRALLEIGFIWIEGTGFSFLDEDTDRLIVIGEDTTTSFKDVLARLAEREARDAGSRAICARVRTKLEEFRAEWARLSN
jgi:hypothetical protein